VKQGQGLSFGSLAIAWGASCSPGASPPPAAASPNGASGAVAEAAEARNPGIPSCKDVGILGCDVPPSSLEELCSRSAPCLVGIDRTDHDPGPTGDFKCDPLQESLRAPSTAGLKSTAVVHIDAAVYSADDPLREEAWYLVAETASGFCLAAPLLSWDFRRDWWWENTFRFTWSKPNGPSPELHAETQFVAMIDENGETFPDHKYCERYQYRVSGGRLSLLAKREEEERCFPEESPESAP